MADSAVHMIARGRVQGVGFRFFVREKAARLGVKGWVKNRADGSVEIHAEGKKEILDDFIDIVREGPRFGRVFDLDADWVDPEGNFVSFSIEF
ncbi:MAG: acylphosphatase [Candidatus Latescibacterota bacterium]